VTVTVSMPHDHVTAVDRAARKLGLSRSAFVAQAAADAAGVAA